MIDFERVDPLLERFNKTTGFITTIIDLEGNVLSKSGWRHICSEFHRFNPQTSERCTISNKELAKEIAKGEKYHVFKCRNGLINVAVPVIINEEHVANLVSGQFFFEKPEIPFFEKQAQEFGFDKDKYLSELSKVPTVPEEQVKAVLDFLLEMTQIISDLSLQNAKQKELNKKIRFDEEKYELFFKHSPIGLVLTRMDGKLMDVNPVYASMIGRTVEETKSLTYWEITPEKYANQEHQQLESLINTGRYGPYEKDYIHKDGHLVPVRLQGLIIEREGQKYIWSSVEDITEPKKAIEEQLKLLNIIEQSRNEIYVFNETNLHFEFINQGALENLGFTLTEMRGMSPLDVKPEFTEENFRKIIKPLQDGSKGQLVFETVHQRKNGTTYPVEVSLQLQKFENKNLFLAITIDNTERKQAENNLLNTQAIMTAIVENTLESIWSINTNFEITYINKNHKKAYQEAFGVEIKQGDNVLDGLPETILPVWKDRYNRVLSGERFLVVDSIEMNGFFKHVEVAMNPIIRDKRIIGASMAGRDITERVQVEETLRKSEHRAAAQRTALTKLALDDILAGENTARAIQHVVEIIAETLTVARASVWILVENDTQFLCLSQYQTDKVSFPQITRLQTSEIPNYLNAIKSCFSIHAEDAQNEPLTSELTDSYFKPLNITSVLDAGIYRDGNLVGVISSEHIGPKRKWHPDEESFISTAGAIVAQILINDERKKAEEAVRVSKNLLDTTQQLTLIGGWEWDIENQKMTWTDETYRIHGMKPGIDIAHSSELIEKSLECYDQNDRQIIDNAFQLCVEKGTPYDLEMQLNRVDGLRIWIRTMANAVKKGDRIVKVVGNIHNITERKRAEEELQIKNWAIESSINAIALADLTGNLTYVNPSFLKLWGYQDVKEVLGRPSIEFWQTSEEPIDVIISLQNQGNWRGEMIARHYDGSNFIVEVSANLVLNHQGIPLCMQASFIDITERKQTEKALQMTQFAMDQAPDCIVWVNDDGELVYTNNAAQAWLGYSSEELVGMKVFNIDPDFPAEGWEQHKKDLKKSGIMTFEGRHQRKDGQLYPVEVTSNYMDHEGRFFSIAFARNITERKKAEEKIQQKSEKLTAMLEISAILAGFHKTDELLQKTTDGTTRLFPHGTAAIYLVQDELSLYLAATTPVLPSDFPEHLRTISLSEHPHICKAFETGSPVIIDDMLKENLTESEQMVRDMRGLRTLLFLPLLHQGKSLGVLIVGSIENIHHFTHEEINLFRTLANQASLEINGARLVEENLNHILNLERLLEEQKQMQKALRESEERYRNIFESAPIGIGIVQNERIALVNSAMKKIFGINTKKQMLENGLANYIHPDIRTDSLRRLQHLMDGEKGLYPTEELCIRPDETVIDVEVMASLLTYRGDPAIQLMITDITEKKRLREVLEKLNIELEFKVEQRTAQLEASNKELEAFSYSVSHDLRAPLRHINGYVDLLNKGCRDELPKQARHYLDTVSKASRQMGTLIDDLLNYSRTGRREVKKTELNMNLLVQVVLEELKAITKERTITWNIQDLPMVYGDYNLLKLVWANLLDNAIKYTRSQKDTEITVSYREEPENYVFCVGDNGVGFDMKYAHKLFGVFQRLHSQAEFEGTGIGLANVQRIIHKHLGRVWTEAEPGKGAKFYFSLPNTEGRKNE